jgi:hypothetical protein
MKILEEIFTLQSGGAERFVVDLSNELVQQGNEEALLRQKVAETLPDLQVNIIYVDHIPLTKSGKRRFIISTLGK